MRRVALSLLLSLLPGSRLAPPGLPHSAYVWQRVHGGAVVDAVAAAPRELGALVWLAAELDPRERTPLTRISLAAARESGRPVGLAVRVHTLPDAAFASDEPPRDLVEALSSTAARARAIGLSPTELQLDFDCPTRRLPTYARWVERLRDVGGEVPLTITALPAWIGAPGFDRLVHASDGFVLQVHSLSLPASRGERARVFDAGAARAGVTRASALGVPFRVALPTHGYGLTFDDHGALADVWAEDGAAPRDAPTHEIAADPVELASFVRWLGRSRPREVVGALWFRLPTIDDRRSVSMRGLASLLRGEPPRSHVVTRVTRDDDGAWSVTVTNDGDAPAPVSTARVGFRRGALAAWDAPGSGATATDDALAFVRVALAPQTSRHLGWLRLTHDDEEIHVEGD